MARYDVVVAGLGGVGLACLSAAARAGLKVAGVDRNGIEGQTCSSRSFRGFRQAYFVDDRYVGLASQAAELWRDLEGRAGVSLLEMTGALQIGPADHVAVKGVVESCRRNGLPYAVLSPADACRHFPLLASGLPENTLVVVEEEAGILNAELTRRAYLQEAEEAGGALYWQTTLQSIRMLGDGAVLELSTGARLQADFVVLAAGYGSPALLERIEGTSWRPPLEVVEQAELYFAGSSWGTLPPLTRIMSDGPYSAVPPRGGEGLKLFRQHGSLPSSEGRVLDDPGFVEFLATFAGDLTPGETISNLRKNHVNRELVTADRNPLAGPHPKLPRIILATGLSGHGFKFVPVLADLVAGFLLDEDRGYDRVQPLLDPGRF